MKANDRTPILPSKPALLPSAEIDKIHRRARHAAWGPWVSKLREGEEECVLISVYDVPLLVAHIRAMEQKMAALEAELDPFALTG